VAGVLLSPPARPWGWARWLLGGSAFFVYLATAALAWPLPVPGRGRHAAVRRLPAALHGADRLHQLLVEQSADFERARAYLLDQTEVDEAEARPFTLHAEGNALPPGAARAAGSPQRVSRAAGAGRSGPRRRW
jgi:hypothetical protein